jgi:hypothetical protein
MLCCQQRYYSSSLTLFGKEYFDMLQARALLTGRIPDQIALLFVYMPHIRDEIHNLVEHWNAYSIRSQPKRPNVKPGKPVVLYFTPPDGTLDYGERAPVSTVSELRSEVLA